MLEKYRIKEEVEKVKEFRLLEKRQNLALIIIFIGILALLFPLFLAGFLIIAGVFYLCFLDSELIQNVVKKARDFGKKIPLR